MRRIGRIIAATTVALATTLAGMPASSADSTTAVPAYGTITISDPGTGVRATWSYDGLFSCTFSTNGPAGFASTATVVCIPSNTETIHFSCPAMIVSRSTLSVVGARSSCERTLDMGVGTSGSAEADLGPVDSSIVCEAYNVGVLVPPYTVTCWEPGLPDAISSLIHKVTG